MFLWLILWDFLPMRRPCASASSPPACSTLQCGLWKQQRDKNLMKRVTRTKTSLHNYWNTHTGKYIFERERNTQNDCMISIITEYKYSERYTEELASVYTPQAQCNLRITTKQAALWIMQRPSGTNMYRDVSSVRLSIEPDKSWCTLLYFQHLQKLYQAPFCPFLRGYQDTADYESIHPLVFCLGIQIC